MDYNLFIFTIFITLALTAATYIEWLYKTKKKENLTKQRAERLDRYIVQERNKRNQPSEKNAMIDYLLKFKLEYDSGTHTYIKVEKLRPEEVEIIKPK